MNDHPRTVHPRAPRGRARAPRLGSGLAARVAALVVAMLLATLAVAPGPVEAATRPMVPACAGVNLRTSPSTTATTKTRLATSAKVTVVGSVLGSSWSTDCAGSKSGTVWYRISEVNGRTATSLYGVRYLYAATGVLKALPAASATPAPTTPATPPPSTAGSADAFGAELMRLINLDRAALGKPAYLIDPGLVAIASDAPFTCPTDPSLVVRGRAADMAARSYFGHYVKGCYKAGTSTAYPSLDVVRTVFGYTLARSEILHWNSYGSAASTTYELGCDLAGSSCVGGTTTTPGTVAIAQRSFMGSSVHRTSELSAYERFGCGAATVPGTNKTYFACLFANGGPVLAPAPTPTPSPDPSPTPAPTPTPDPGATPAPTPTPAPGSQPMVPACDDVNLRTGATTTAATKTRLPAGATVTVTATVAGSAWSTDCAGPKAGAAWHKISHINGTSVKALYGITSLFAATGVLVPATTAPTSPSVPGTTPAAPTTGATSLGATVTFFGRGWGHGVGLSQYGARGRALAGQDAATILAHYYVGTTIGAIGTETAIRVLLLDNAASTSASPLTVVGRGGEWTIDGVAAAFPADARLRLLPVTTGTTTSWRLVVDIAGVVAFDGPASYDVRLRGTSPATTFQLPARAATYNLYRGSLRIVRSGTTFDVVNELSLEDYLRGVVPAEMPSSWPVAARTAQTIAARSYAANHLRPGVSTFDVYDDTRSQVYLGVRGETSAADAVAAATVGQVLVYGSTIANALFHSTGGGATESNENVYVSSSGARVASPVAYLRGSADRDEGGVAYDAAAPYATWQTATYTLAQLSAIFAADARTNVGSLVALDLRDRGISGRLISVTLVGTAGARTVSGGVFVAAFNAGRPTGDPSARSTLLDLAPIP